MLFTGEIRFCEAYIESGDIADSYINAGFKVPSRQTAYNRGKSLLKDIRIQEYIDELQEALKANDIDLLGPKEVQLFWSEVVRDESANLRDRLRASENIAKTHNMFTEQTDVVDNININIETI